jgi:hypothetical protein
LVICGVEYDPKSIYLLSLVENGAFALVGKSHMHRMPNRCKVSGAKYPPPPFAPVQLWTGSKGGNTWRLSDVRTRGPLAPVRNWTGAKGGGGPFAPDALHRLGIRCIWPLPTGAKAPFSTSVQSSESRIIAFVFYSFYIFWYHQYILCQLVLRLFHMSCRLSEENDSTYKCNT